MSAVLKRLLRPIVDVQQSEVVGLVLMFCYSFLAMTAYNILKPLTRSQFIRNLGADNLPYVLLAAGVLIGFIMAGYSRMVGLLPRKWVIPIVQVGIAGLLVLFWFLFQTKAEWVSVGFYFLGLIMGILLISQFWTLANVIYDPRQAKRVFGFIGGGSSLGGATGSWILTSMVALTGPTNLLLVSAAILLVCAVIVVLILRRQADIDLSGITETGEESGVKWTEAFSLLRQSKHLQIIAMVIGFAAVGAAIIEQQLNMAAEVFATGGTDLEKILGSVQLYLSIIGFVVQVWLTSRIHKYLGIGFALLILPVSLGTTGLVMLFNAVLWAPMMARISDTSLRYTVDKTTREILFLPLPTDLKNKAKPFVDVTMDRLSKGIGALLILVMIKPWGLNFTWQQLSYASLTLTALWIVAAMAAKRGYLRAFRQSIERKDVSPGDVRLNVADLQTVETLIGELADPDEKRVIYAIDILESLDKRNLITPLLLYHESPRVRARALGALAGASADVADRWLPNVQRMLMDTDPNVRTAAVGALASMRSSTVADLVRPFLAGEDPRLAATAAAVLAKSGEPSDLDAAEATLSRLAADAGRAEVRRDVAAAVGQVNRDRFHHLLVPLLYDGDPSVAEEAMKSLRQLKAGDFSFVPTLVSLLRHRKLKGTAREVLIGYGDAVVPALEYFLNDTDEDLWVRRHIPATLAAIGTQAAMDALSRALGGATDGFLRFKLVEAIERLHRAAPALTLDAKPFEPLVAREANRYFTWLSLRYNLFSRAGLPAGSLLDRALGDKLTRTVDRLWRLLAIQYPPADMDAARAAIAGRDAKARASALEYLDNVFAGPVRKKVLPIFDEMPLEERVRKGNVIISSRPRDAEETLLQLINDEDQIVAASAIHTVAEHRTWTLADDIEHVLAHRDARDWFVFEAASWALAAQRMPEDRRRSLWNEPLPAVEVAARLAASPIFATTWVDELFRIAGAGRQVRSAANTVLYSEGQSPEALQFLLDGSVTLTARDGTSSEAVPTAALGFEEVVQNHPMRASARTNGRSICLALTIEECRGLLAENPDLVEGLFRTILDDAAFAAGAAVVKGTGEDAVRLAGDGLSPIEKVLALQRISTFAHFRTDELLALANAARRVPLVEGATLFGEGTPPSLFILVSGEIALEHPSAPRLDAGPGDAVGLYETLAGRPVQRSARVTRPGVALRLDRDDVFDALGERPGLLQQLFTALFGARGGAVAEVA
jgi:ATP/ADP translocase/CRP-like cAMP-binding protein